MPSKSSQIFACSNEFIEAEVVGRSSKAIAFGGEMASAFEVPDLSTAGRVSVAGCSSCSAIAPVPWRCSGGPVNEKLEKDMLTKESRGRPSKSGSGRFPYLELFDADRARVPAVKEPLGDIM
jgi:hypothetical protein